MEHIGSLFSHANASRGEAEVFTAAAALAVINDVLRRYGYTEKQAHAVSIVHRRAKIIVSHGAIGGRLQQQEESFLEDVNTVLRQRFPQYRNNVEGFYTPVG